MTYQTRVTIVLFVTLAMSWGGRAVFAQGGISVDGSTVPVPTVSEETKGLIERLKAFTQDTDKTAQDSVELAQDIGEGVEQSGSRGTLGKVWSAIKSFFAEKSVQDILGDTLKLMLRVAVNVVILVVEVVQRIIAALRS